VRIGDKDLTLIPQADLVQQIMHAQGIQFFKDIIKEQDGGPAFVLFEGFVFGQPEGEEEAFSLALGSDGFERLTGKAEFKIVLMNATAGALEIKVLLPTLVKQVAEGGVQQLTFVYQGYGFLHTGNLCIEAAGQRQQLFQEVAPAVEKPTTRADQLAIVYFQQTFVGKPSFCEGFQEAVALLQDLIIFDQVLQIVGVQLGKKGVEETAALLTAARDDLHIVGGDDDTGETADMTGELLIRFAAREELLFPCLPQDTNDVGELALLFKMPFNPETRRPLLNILLVAAREIAFGKTKVINGVQQVGLTHAIVATETHDPFRKPEGSLAVVLELKKRYIF